MHKNACALPWSHVAVNMDGRVRPCCRWKDFQTNLPHVSDGIDNALNGTYFQTVRERMLRGEKLENCVKCWDEEASGKVNGMRQSFLERYGEHMSSSPKLRFLEIGFSSHCNLGCRMCDEGASSTIHRFKFPNKKIPLGFNVNSDDFDTDLSELEQIKIIGGEPMLAKEHDDFIERLQQSNCILSNIKLVYHTNCTILPNPAIVEFWKKVKQVEIIISIDGVGRVNEVQRPGHVWQTLLDVLDFYNKLRNDSANIKLRTHSLVTILNVFNLQDLYDFSISNIVSTPKDIVWDIISNRPELELRNASDEKKTQMKEYILLSSLPDTFKNTIIYYIDKSPHKIYSHNDIKKSQQLWDDYFKQDIRDYL